MPYERVTPAHMNHIDKIGKLILTANKFVVLLAMSNALTPQNLLLIFSLAHSHDTDALMKIIYMDLWVDKWLGVWIVRFI